MHDDAVLHTALRELRAEGVAFRVGQVLLPGGVSAAAGPSAAPQAVGRGTVKGADLAPIVKPVAVRPVQRQEHPVQLVELKQPGQMKIRFSEFHDQSSSRIFSFSTTQPAMVARAAKEAMAPVMCSLYQPNSDFGDVVPSCEELIVETLL